jgi:hypothetical protein
MLNEHCKKWSFQQEKAPTTGRLHFQGRLWLKKKARLGAVIKMFPRLSHLTITSEAARSNDDYVTKSETRVAGPWKSTDKEPTPCPRQLRGITLRPWQQHVVNDANVWDTRTINIIYDPVGNSGKSTLGSHILYAGVGRKIPFSNDFRDIMRMIMCMPTSKLYIMDMPRSLNKDHLYQFYAAIEEIKNGYAYDDRYAFKEKQFDCPNIWIFTNKLPDQRMLSADRWKLWEIVNGQDLVPFKESDSPEGSTVAELPSIEDSEILSEPEPIPNSETEMFFFNDLDLEDNIPPPSDELDVYQHDRWAS